MNKKFAPIFFIALILFAAFQVLDNDSSKAPTTEKAAPVDTTIDAKETSDEEVPEVPEFSIDVASLGDTFIGDLDITNWEIEHGELLSVIYSGDGIVVVKTKIESSFSNSATINQNYYNVCDLIENHGFNTCSELQYWAVADMADGSEAKVISFTLDSNTIQGVYNDTIVDRQLDEYVDDLFILPSLQD